MVYSRSSSNSAVTEGVWLIHTRKPATQQAAADHLDPLNKPVESENTRDQMQNTGVTLTAAVLLRFTV